MSQPKIIVFAGLPLTGKSTLAKPLEDRLKIARLDIDEIRQMLFRHHPLDSETNRELDQAQMRSSCESLYALAANVLLAGESVIVAGPFSREIQHQKAKTIAETYGAIQKVVFCYSSDQVISERIKLRRLDEENPSNLRSMDGYNRVKERYVKISAPELLEIDTAESSESCLKKIIKFVLE